MRKGSLLSMILSPSSPEYAKSLREAIDYETQVTWNEPSQTATDPPIISTLVKIIMGTGVFMVAAIVLGHCVWRRPCNYEDFLPRQSVRPAESDGNPPTWPLREAHRPFRFLLSTLDNITNAFSRASNGHAVLRLGVGAKVS